MKAAEFFLYRHCHAITTIRVVKGAFRGRPLVEGRAYGWMLNCVRCWADRRQVGDETSGTGKSCGSAPTDAWLRALRVKLGPSVGHYQNSPHQNAHQVAILRGDTGRFLVCRLCHLSFEFPHSTTFEATSRKFESRACEPEAQEVQRHVVECTLREMSNSSVATAIGSRCPYGAIQVVTPSEALSSNVAFRVLP
jgi:hypothetical protein